MMKDDTPKKKKFRWVPGFIRHDFWRKFFALLFAALVTAAIYSNKRKSMETDVNFNNVKPDFFLEEGYEWVRQNPQMITLLLQGPRDVLSDLKPEDFEIRKSIAEKEYTEKHVKLDVKDVVCHHPKAGLIRVADITPREYTLHVQKIVTKTVDVKIGTPMEKDNKRLLIDFTGKLPDGYYFDGAELLEEPKVRVTGPEDLVNTLQHIVIKPVSLDNHVSSFTTVAELIVPDDRCSLDRSRVKIRIHIGRYLIKKYSRIPILVMDNDDVKKDGFVTIPEGSRTVMVELMGEKNEFDTLPDDKTGNHIYAFIRKSDLREGNNNTVNIQCVVANKQLRVINVNPSTINGVVLTVPTEEKENPAVEEQPAKEEGKKTDDPQKK